MSKLPIAAFYPTGSTPANLFEAHTRNSTRRQGGGPIAHNSINRTAPIITLADSNNTSSPVVLCVDGVLLWLLIAWITAGTAAIITLIVKSCRNRWKHGEQEEFDWGALERSQPTRSQQTRSTSCSSVPSVRNAIPTTKPSVPSSSRFTHRASTRHTSSRRTELEDANRRHKSRSRRLQSTTA
ncbi:uncharacterized protein LOC116921545 [Daphnia magna]|uniref:Transmembrane protein n=1 Tax=Daphnia magna TaxID=35525 RepID=A0ABQ9ZDE8_9CRUS|nr:uncharacterized protein LOC116921545 [Daphnia magna]KAK4010948.1 hypothetical protein OUZ56_020067 [Daphnia magna]